MSYWKAFVRVVKSLDWMSHNVVEERLIKAESRDEVKKYMIENYGDLFPDGKAYTRETKDEKQFFYIVIYPLYDWEIEFLHTKWKCAGCGFEHNNKYLDKPFNKWIKSEAQSLSFCDIEGLKCYHQYMEDNHSNFVGDDDYYTYGNPIYIYKITEKETNKCYIGKTKNAPFFRWWNHLKHSNSPFGKYLSQTKLSEWTFEVLEELETNTSDEDVLLIESKYIIHYESLNNGFNSVISNKKAIEIKEQLKIDL